MTDKRWRRIVTRAVVIAATASLCSCANWQGLNSLPMPGTEGSGPGWFEVQAQMPDVNTIQPNTRVRLGDVDVGTVRKIELQGWHALLTLRLNGDVQLPANATVKVGLTSLLGSMHVELAPPTDAAPQGRLHQGSLIPLSSAGAFPSTEQTLAALSLVLNGGGLGQVQDITEALSTALRGREQDFRDLVGALVTFTRNLNEQTSDIIAATESLNRLVGKFAENKPVLDTALRTIPDALAVLNGERQNLVEVADKLSKFSALTVDTVDQTKDKVVHELTDLGPVLESLANAGPSMTRALSLLTTYPFPNDTLEKWQRGDSANLTAIFDLTLSRIDQGFFTGTRFEGDLTELEMQWGRTIGQFPSPYTAGNPLVAPYHWNQGP
jgi:phospholipid/cholesterol/gamma-HCH transport system substrate-binding protein